MNRWLAIGKESNWGEEATNLNIIRILSESIKTNLKTYQSDAIVNSRIARNRGIGSKFIEGDFEFEMTPDFGLILLLAFGTENIPEQLESTSAYKHVFTPIEDYNTELPSSTIIIARDFKVYKYLGARISELSFTAALDSYIKGKASIIAKEEKIVDSFTTPQELSLPSFEYIGSKIVIDSTLFPNAESFDFSLKNNIEAKHTLNQTNKPYKIKHKALDVSGKIDIEFNQDTYFFKEKLENNDSAKIELLFEGTNIEGDYNYLLKLIINNAKYDPFDINIAGQGDEMKVSIPWKAYKHETLEAITAELINTKNDQY